MNIRTKGPCDGSVVVVDPTAGDMSRSLPTLICDVDDAVSFEVCVCVCVCVSNLLVGAVELGGGVRVVVADGCVLQVHEASEDLIVVVAAIETW